MISFKETLELSARVLQAIEDAGITSGMEVQILLRSLSAAHAIASGLSIEEYQKSYEVALPLYWEIGKMMVGKDETPRSN